MLGQTLDQHVVDHITDANITDPGAFNKLK